MNVYDFDGTIYYPNVMVSFSRYCIKHHPHLIFTYLFPFIGASIKYAFKKISRDDLFSLFDGVCKHLKNPEKELEGFWKKHEKNMSSWYLAQRRSDDIVISGSPSYVIQPIADKLGFNLVATKINLKTGELEGEVILARQKAKYFIERDMPFIDNFYSDSVIDTPLALLAENAHLVTKKATTITPWPHIDDIRKKVNKKINK